jgi:hypothetical protein
MDTCPRASRAHISEEREEWTKVWGQVEPTSPRMESPNLKNIRKEI